MRDDKQVCVVPGNVVGIFCFLSMFTFSLLFHVMSFHPSHHQAWRCDMAVLVFDPSSRESLDYISRMQVGSEPSVPFFTLTVEKTGIDVSEAFIPYAQTKELEMNVDEV